MGIRHCLPDAHQILGHSAARSRFWYDVTLIGDVPKGPDGRESELVAGKPFTNDNPVVVRS
jgi:hypothetical protein